MSSVGSWSNPDHHPEPDWEARKIRAEEQIKDEMAWRARQPITGPQYDTYQEELEAKIRNIQELAQAALDNPDEDEGLLTLRNILDVIE